MTGPVVRVSIVGQHPRPEVEWPDGWPVPREGEFISLKVGDGSATTVRTVVYYPQGEDGDPEPFVYVVVGPAFP